MPLHAPNTLPFLLLALAPFGALATEGVIHFSGAVTTPLCPLLLAQEQPVPVRLATEGPGCVDSGRVAELRVETVGEPQEGLAVVTVQVF